MEENGVVIRLMKRGRTKGVAVEGGGQSVQDGIASSQLTVIAVLAKCR